MLDVIRAIEAEQIRTDLPEFHVGDTIKIDVRICNYSRYA